MTLTQHPLSAAFPALEENRMEELVKSIRENGLRNPGILFDGMVLDGWHRYQACDKCGIEFIATEFTGDDPVAFVIDCNLQRRQLTASQRGQAIVSVMEWKPTGRPTATVDNEDDIGKEVASNHLSNAQMADLAGVGKSTIKYAKAAHEAGLGDAVIAGKISAKAAAHKASDQADDEEEEKPHIKIQTPFSQREFNKLEARALELQQINDALNARVEELETVLNDYDSLVTEHGETLKVLESDDRVKTLMDENKKLREQLRLLNEHIASLQGSRNSAIQHAKAAQNKLAAYERAATTPVS